MINIEGHWEIVNDLHDVSRVIREYYNSELADEMDELIESSVMSDTDIARLEELEELEDIIDQIRDLVI